MPTKYAAEGAPVQRGNSGVAICAARRADDDRRFCDQTRASLTLVPKIIRDPISHATGNFVVASLTMSPK